MDRRLSLSHPETARHPEVHHEIAVVIERSQEVLATTVECVDAGADRGRRVGELRRAEGPRLDDRAPADQRLELPANRFDLRQLRHVARVTALNPDPPVPTGTTMVVMLL